MTKQRKIFLIAGALLFGACVSLSTLTHDFADKSRVAGQFDDGKTAATLKCQRAALEGIQDAKRDATAALISKKRATELRTRVYDACKHTEAQDDMGHKSISDGGVDPHKVDAQ
jgi:hypothetical protein